jgi:hypothetical protein
LLITYSRRGGNFSGSSLGYQGSLILPRELFISTVTNVTSSAKLVKQKASWWSTSHVDGTASVHTLGVRPAAELVTLRNGSTHFYVNLEHLVVPSDEWKHVYTAKSSTYELRTMIAFGKDDKPAGIVLRASGASGEATLVSYDPAAEELRVDRSRASLLSFASHAPAGSTGYIASYTERGKLRLWEVGGVRQQLNLIIYGRSSRVSANSSRRLYAPRSGQLVD